MITGELQHLAEPIEGLKPHPDNPRVGNVAVIAESLKRFGQVRPIIATQKGVIVAGNHTWKAAMELGWGEIAVVRVSMTKAEERAYLLADNRTADLAVYSEPDLAALVEAVANHRDGLDGTGWSRDDLDELLSRAGAAGPVPGGDEAGPDVEPDNRGSLLELTDVTIRDPDTDAPVGSVWRLIRDRDEVTDHADPRPHVLVVATLDAADVWREYLEAGMRFGPLPTPHAPFSDPAVRHPHLFVLPWPYIAGHVIDAWTQKGFTAERVA